MSHLMHILRTVSGSGVEAVVAEVIASKPPSPDELDAALFIASSRNPRCVGQLLAAGARVDARDDAGMTPLHHAAERQSPDAVRALLAAGAEPNVVDKKRRTPLMIAAARTGSRRVLELLLEGGAEIAANRGAGRERTCPGAMALLAERTGKRLPKSMGAARRWLAARREQSVLVEGELANAASGGWNAYVRLLLLAGDDPRGKLHGKPALMSALESGFIDTAEILLSSGANVSDQDANGWTALHVASSPEIVDWLMIHGADLSMLDHSGQSAAQRNRPVRDWLQEHGRLDEELDRIRTADEEARRFAQVVAGLASGGRPTSFTWASNPEIGVHLTEGRVCWYTKHANPHSGGGACFQSFRSFLDHGQSGGPPAPREVLAQLREVIEQAMSGARQRAG